MKQDAEFWAATAGILADASAVFRNVARPAIVPFPYEGEEWKEQQQIDDKEGECFFETEEILRTFCRTQKWPDQWPGETRYFIARRLAWAEGWVRILRIPYEKTGQPFLSRPPESAFEFIEWLLTDCYVNRYPPARRVKMMFGPSGPNPLGT